MPADTLLWDEDACLDAIKVFVVAACKGAVKSGDVYRWRGSAVPATTTRPSILLGIDWHNGATKQPCPP